MAGYINLEVFQIIEEMGMNVFLKEKLSMRRVSGQNVSRTSMCRSQRRYRTMAQGNQKVEQEKSKGRAGSKAWKHAPVLGGWKSA